MKIAFIHPDLGLGGAERLVVNAALSLQSRGHNVHIYTAHHDKTRAFSETTNEGVLASSVFTYGDFLPRHLLNRFHVVCAILRMMYVSLVLLLAHRNEMYDLIICDQVSHVVPLLLGSKRPVLFYCHYPDKLLCVDRGWLLKRLYRKPVDWLEERTTAMATRVVVNSKFTAEVFKEAFPSIHMNTAVLYPAIDLTEFDQPLTKQDIVEAREGLDDALLARLDDPGCACVLSINRFERKKNLSLAIEAVHELKTRCKDNVVLVMAGGFDARLEENIEYLKELQELSDKLSITADVFFVRSFTDKQKLFLLSVARCVVYTPDKEHFGIVPIEAMYAGKPVVAVSSGGPLESIVHESTGFLVPQSAKEFAKPLLKLVQNQEFANDMGKTGRLHVASKFSLEAFGKSLEEIANELIAENTTNTNNSSMWFYILCVVAVVSACIISSQL